MATNITACGRCGGGIAETMRFCPACGRRINPRDRKLIIVIGIAGLTLFSAGFALERYLIPRPNTDAAKQHSELPMGAPVEDPQLIVLREQLEKDPQNIEKLKMMAAVLGDKIRQEPEGPPALAYEAIDVLSRILAISPDDPDALVLMADVSFDQKAFTQAEKFYVKHLEIVPDNLGARARYASTLTFLGRFPEAIEQLNTVLKQDPKNFPAMAYLSITYAQQGDLKKAKEIGAKALELAPSDEARDRFSAFMTSLEAEVSTGMSPARGNTSAPQNNQAPAQTGVEGFVAAIRSNPVAGPKFVSFEDSKKGDIKLFFKDFPMSQMPPFAKEKFFSSLRKAAEASQLGDVKTVTFVDAISGAQMEQITLAQK